MWIVLLLFGFAFPGYASAQNVGDLSPNPFNNNSIGNPFSPGGSLSPIRQSGPNGGRAAPTSPYSWSNVSPPVSGPTIVYNPSNPLPTGSPNSLSLHVPGSQFGPSGITLPADHPLGMGTR
jgi:hypothetical protein